VADPPKPTSPFSPSDCPALTQPSRFAAHCGLMDVDGRIQAGEQNGRKNGWRDVQRQPRASPRGPPILKSAVDRRSSARRAGLVPHCSLPIKSLDSFQTFANALAAMAAGGLAEAVCAVRQQTNAASRAAVHQIRNPDRKSVLRSARRLFVQR